MELGWTYPKRKKRIEELLLTPSPDRRYPLTFQGSNQYFSVYTIPIELPKYRLNNGRTYASQAEYLSHNSELAADFFIKDPESVAAIEVQHNLLKELISEKGMDEYFKAHKQEQPLILTHEGFVLNGNRRLCAMRELLQADPKTYSHFEHIDVIILSPADEKDIDELEAQLQIHKDIKADYTWVTFALMLKRRQDDHGYSAEHLARIYEMKDSEVNDLLDNLAYAEDYLKKRGWKGEYHRVEQDKYAFDQIRKKRPKFNKEQEKEIFENIAYTLLDNPEGGRLYDLIPDSANYLDKILDQMEEELEIPPAKSEEDNGMDILGGFKEQNTQNYVGILSAFEDTNNSETIRNIVIDVIKREQLKEKEKKKSNFVLTQVRKANAALTDAVNAVIPETSKTGIDEQIEALEKSIAKLRLWLND